MVSSTLGITDSFFVYDKHPPRFVHVGFCALRQRVDARSFLIDAYFFFSIYASLSHSVVATHSAHSTTRHSSKGPHCLWSKRSTPKREREFSKSVCIFQRQQQQQQRFTIRINDSIHKGNCRCGGEFSFDGDHSRRTRGTTTSRE